MKQVQLGNPGGLAVMNNKVLFLYFILLTISITTFAQTSTMTNTATSTSQGSPEATTSGSIESVLKNKKFEDDKDITDSKLKADSGSLSRYSLKFSLSYYGPPVGDLSEKNTPNPDGSIGNYATALSGSMSGRYRLDSKSAISLGTGISANTPFHGVERMDVKTPFVSYDRSSRLGDLQLRNSYGASVTTVPNFREVGQYGSLSYDNSLIYNMGASGFAVGLDSGISYFLYEREYDAKKDRTASRYYIGLYPQVKYNFSDKTNLYASVALSFTNPRALENEWAMLNKTMSGRVGMGMAFTRDIYFAPYLNFYPKEFNWKSTTVSFSTIFSIL